MEEGGPPEGAVTFLGSGQQTPLEEENRSLRADVKRLEMECDILKKRTTDSRPRRPVSANVLDREFTASKSNE